MDKDTPWLFPCSTNDNPGVLIPDSAATKCHADGTFVKKAHVPIQKLPIRKQVELAGGKKLTVYGTCHFPINISGWQEIITAYVLDLDAEFDVVLELDWIRKRKPSPDWDTMLTLEHEGKVYLLVPFPRRITSTDGEPEWKLNTIAFRQALNALKRPDVQAVLYYIRNLEADAEVEAGTEEQMQLHGPEIQAVVAECPDVFKDELPDHLPPTRGLVHEIDTGDSEPINRLAYQLSAW
jgi:hypothetical protein